VKTDRKLSLKIWGLSGYFSDRTLYFRCVHLHSHSHVVCLCKVCRISSAYLTYALCTALDDCSLMARPADKAQLWTSVLQCQHCN